jgi:hypothetical protein
MVDALNFNLGEKTFAPKVRELHVDFLLEEEFFANPTFLRDFVRAAKREDAPLDVIEVRHSAVDQHGEADLIVVYRVEGDRKVGLLIEDKIRAVFQPDQALRYDLRRKAGINTKSWDDCWTCLVAPRSYIEKGHQFDVALPLELIKEWFAPDQPQRQHFKAEVIDRAIKKAETLGVQEVDLAMTKFRRSYYESLNDFFRSAHIKATMGMPADSWKGENWFYLRSNALPKGVHVHHKSDRGFVDLTFPDAHAERLTDLRKCLEPGMKIEQTGKSVAIRLEVSSIIRFDDFEQEKDKVYEALTEVARLLDFYDRERTQIEDILSRARRPQHNLHEGSLNA